MSLFKIYLNNIEDSFQTGKATEHTYRPALKELIESLAENIHVINEPKRIECGAPDFIVSMGTKPIGYIEAKDLNESLTKIEKGEQMKRYREGLANLILTDYLEFRWYVTGELRMTARLTNMGDKGKLLLDKKGITAVHELLNAFINVQALVINTPKDLATRMAGMARLIRTTLRLTLMNEHKNGQLHQQMAGFRQVLLHDMTEDQFVDMYAQTLCYGLFAARCNTVAGQPFTRIQAAHNIPNTNPFLRRIFGYITGPDLDEEPYAWAVDDLAEMLNLVDIQTVLKDFGRRTRQEDPVVHFYETFLAAYDPALRETRGVYYTPEPVVSYIVRSVDHILKSVFGLKDGLADTSKVRVLDQDGKQRWKHKVLILDPATGTGTFLHGVIDLIYETFRGNKGMWSGYVSEHLLPRLYGFELLMAPYAVAHMKLDLQLAETGYNFQAEKRLNVYLTNSLEEPYEYANMPLFSWWLAEEVNAASEIKARLPIMVILGNPPYSGHSVNIGKWINGLLRGIDIQTNRKTESYFEVDGKPLGEKNPKWLNDDYVKFMRFAQWSIEQTGYGIMAFVTNHGYLDNPTFRGMRQSLIKTFDNIYILNLHGNSKKKEKCPDGSKDENVFDIQQGVAIGIFVRKQGNYERQATVKHADLWGTREVFEEAAEKKGLISGKYFWLLENNVATSPWITLEPKSPFYLFIPQDERLRAEYEQGWNLSEVMPINSVGIATARDSLTIHWNCEEVWKTVNDFISLPTEDARIKYALGKDSQDWKVAIAQEDLRLSGPSGANIVPILYRPFDIRYTYYTGKSSGFHCRPRKGVMFHMLAGENIGLITNRHVRDDDIRHTWLTQQITDLHILQTAHASAYIFPLYIYPYTKKEKLEQLSIMEPERCIVSHRRNANFNPDTILYAEKRLGLTFITDNIGDLASTFGPEDLFHYIYAIMQSPMYRTRYAEFLKIDFPRIPFTSNTELFRTLCNLGECLVALHLVEAVTPLITKYPVAGDNTVDKAQYTEPGQGAAQGRVWINNTQYFEEVAPEVWEFHIGGYQVCEKWLKDRKGCQLSYDDLTHYQKIVSVLSETISLMAFIDEAIEKHGGWPLN